MGKGGIIVVYVLRLLRDLDVFCIYISLDDGLVADGVLQEVWHNISDVTRGVISLQNDSRFPNAPDIVTVHEGFDVYDFDTKVYGQRLTAYLLVCVTTLNEMP